MDSLRNIKLVYEDSGNKLTREFSNRCEIDDFTNSNKVTILEYKYN
jgi:hypothetical protein